MHAPGEDLVLAVFRPRLGDALQFDICRVRRQTERCTRALHPVGCEIVPDRVHFIEAQRKDAFAADAKKFRIRPAKIIRSDADIGRFTDGRDHIVDRGGSPFFGGKDLDGVNQRIRQQVPPDAPGIVFRQRGAAEKILNGSVDGLERRERAIEHILHNGFGRCPNVICHARLESDFNHPVKSGLRQP